MQLLKPSDDGRCSLVSHFVALGCYLANMLKVTPLTCDGDMIDEHNLSAIGTKQVFVLALSQLSSFEQDSVVSSLPFSGLPVDILNLFQDFENIYKQFEELKAKQKTLFSGIDNTTDMQAWKNRNLLTGNTPIGQYYTSLMMPVAQHLTPSMNLKAHLQNLKLVVENQLMRDSGDPLSVNEFPEIFPETLEKMLEKAVTLINLYVDEIVSSHVELLKFTCHFDVKHILAAFLSCNWNPVAVLTQYFCPLIVAMHHKLSKDIVTTYPFLFLDAACEGSVLQRLLLSSGSLAPNAYLESSASGVMDYIRALAGIQDPMKMFGLGQKQVSGTGLQKALKDELLHRTIPRKIRFFFKDTSDVDVDIEFGFDTIIDILRQLKKLVSVKKDAVPEAWSPSSFQTYLPPPIQTGDDTVSIKQSQYMSHLMDVTAYEKQIIPTVAKSSHHCQIVAVSQDGICFTNPSALSNLVQMQIQHFASKNPDMFPSGYSTQPTLSADILSQDSQNEGMAANVLPPIPVGLQLAGYFDIVAPAGYYWFHSADATGFTNDQDLTDLTHYEVDTSGSISLPKENPSSDESKSDEEIEAQAMEVLNSLEEYLSEFEESDTNSDPRKLEPYKTLIGKIHDPDVFK